jgi:hypothetical protein
MSDLELAELEEVTRNAGFDYPIAWALGFLVDNHNVIMDMLYTDSDVALEYEALYEEIRHGPIDEEDGMANYFTQFSIEIEDLTDAEREWARENIVGYAVELDDIQFEYEFIMSGLWIYAEENGVPEAVAYFVQDFFRKFRPNAVKTIGWANTCSKPVADAFGGGYVLVTAQELVWISSGIEPKGLLKAATRLVAIMEDGLCIFPGP